MESTPSPSRGDRTHTAIDRLVRVMRLHHRVIERRIDGLGIHHSQHRMLMRLSCTGGAASQKDLAAALDVSPACVARTLKALNAAGLIDKSEGADGRRRKIGILPKGQRLIDDSFKTFREIDREMFAGISDEEVRQLTDILSRIHQNLADMENRNASPERSEASL